jgi:hypothetical protein
MTMVGEEGLCGCLLASARAVDRQIPGHTISTPEASMLCKWWGHAQLYAINSGGQCIS